MNIQTLSELVNIPAITLYKWKKTRQSYIQSLELAFSVIDHDECKRFGATEESINTLAKQLGIPYPLTDPGFIVKKSTLKDWIRSGEKNELIYALLIGQQQRLLDSMPSKLRKNLSNVAIELDTDISRLINLYLTDPDLVTKLYMKI